MTLLAEQWHILFFNDIFIWFWHINDIFCRPTGIFGCFGLWQLFTTSFCWRKSGNQLLLAATARAATSPCWQQQPIIRISYFSALDKFIMWVCFLIFLIFSWKKKFSLNHVPGYFCDHSKNEIKYTILYTPRVKNTKFEAIFDIIMAFFDSRMTLKWHYFQVKWN